MARIEFLGGGPQILLGDGAVGLGLPLAGQGADEFAILQPDLGIALPGRAAAELGRVEAVLAELGEEAPPAGFDRIGIVQILAVEGFDEAGIAAEQERGRVENRVGGGSVVTGWVGLARHFNMLGQLFGLGPVLGPAENAAAPRKGGCV